MSNALFAGSFNPFTIGHASVVERAASMFEKIIIAIGVNPEKEGTEPGEAVKERIASIKQYASRFPDGKIEVISYSGKLTADLAKELGCDYLLRGVRSVKDFEYERDLADINRRISGIETVLLFTLPEHAAISSSVVRELSSYGYDVSSFLP